MAFITIKTTTKDISAVMIDNETELESNVDIESGLVVHLLHFVPPTNVMVYINNDTRFIYNILKSDWENNCI